jgi:hypothetical protein
MFDVISRNDPPAITHPGFFYGFASAALAWQIAFFFIAKDPIRYRPLMIPSIFEKTSYALAVIILVLQGRMHRSDLVFGVVDLLFGAMFLLSYIKTKSGRA